MPAPQRVLKDIYKFKTVDELQSAVNDVNLKNLLIGYKKMLTNGQKLYDNAVLKYKEGDEELAYVFFMRAIQLFQNARQCRDYKEKVDFKHWMSMCGNQIKESVEKCEELLSSLSRRYSILNEINQVQLKEKEDAEELEKERSKSNAAENNEKIKSFQFTNLSKENIPPVSQKILQESDKFITCEKLYQILSSNKNESFLILDIRPEVEYASSKIHTVHCINVPPELFQEGVIASRIESQIKPAERIEFRKRHAVDYVILVDWSADVNDLKEKGRLLRILWDALYQYDNTPLKHAPVVLDGGFHSFINCYPTLTTSPAYRRRETAGSDLKLSVDSNNTATSYPDFDKLSRSWKETPKTTTVEAPVDPVPSPLSIPPKQQPIIPDRKLKPGSTGDTKASMPARPPSPPVVDDSHPPATSVDVEYDNAISVSKHLDLKNHFEGIGKKLLDAGRLTSKIVVGESLVTDDDAEAVAETLSRNEMDSLKEKIVDDEIAIRKRQEKIDALEELRKKKPSISPPTTTINSTPQPPAEDVEALTREINELKAENENVKRERDASLQELQRRRQLDELRRHRKMNERRDPTPAESKSKEEDDSDDRSQTEETGENSSTAAEDYNPLRRAQSSPDVVKLIAKETKIAPSPPPPERPNIPDRSVKPTSFRTYEQSYQQESEYFKRALDNIRAVYGTVSRGLTGLQNLGSTCYMNSTVQCLSNTPALREFFLNDEYRRDINYTNVLGYKGEVARGFAVILHALWSGKYKYIVPYEFKAMINTVAEMFRGHEQQDAQEFMAFLLDGLHEDLNKVKTREKIGEQDNTNISLDVAAGRAWQNHLKNDNSVIVDRFQGQFLNHIVCSVCRTESKVFEVLMYLSLPLPPKEETNECLIDDCFKKFLQPERMSDDGRWYCPTCKQKRDAYKRFVIWKLPKILIIHFKRFTRRGRWHEKLETMVNFPLQLKMDEYITGPKNPETMYRLYAVVNHYGTMEGGHYTAYCKNGSNWYDYDDCTIREISQGAVKSRAAYILFYAAC